MPRFTGYRSDKQAEDCTTNIKQFADVTIEPEEKSPVKDEKTTHTKNYTDDGPVQENRQQASIQRPPIDRH